MAENRKKIEGEQVVLDYGEFYDTDFLKCVIIYKGGRPPVLVNNNFTKCRWEFDAEALNTLRFLRALAHGGVGGKEFVTQQLLGFADS